MVKLRMPGIETNIPALGTFLISVVKFVKIPYSDQINILTDLLLSFRTSNEVFSFK